MRFRTKDLMITVVPRMQAEIDPELRGFCILYTMICGGAVSIESTCPHWSAMQVNNPCTGCPHTTIWTMCTPAGVTLEPLVLNDRQDLAVLRLELQETLTQLDEIEKKLPTGFGTKEKAKAMATALDEVAKQIRKAASDLK